MRNTHRTTVYNNQQSLLPNLQSYQDYVLSSKGLGEVLPITIPSNSLANSPDSICGCRWIIHIPSDKIRVLITVELVRREFVIIG